MNQEEQGKKMAQLIAKCWADEAFKQKLLADPAATLKKEGVELPDGRSVKAVENTDEVFHLVIPLKEEGVEMGQLIAKCWADEGFKQKLLADPAATLAAEGIELPDGLSVKAVENTDKVFHLVIPPQPSDSELSDEDLDVVAGGGLQDIKGVKPIKDWIDLEAYPSDSKFCPCFVCLL